MANLPRRGTMAAKALSTLAAAGSPLDATTLASRCGWARGRFQFEEVVVGAVCAAGLARIGRRGIEITRDGQRFVDGDKPEVPTYQGVPAAPRTAIVDRPLRSRSPMVIRDGALDYRNFPSRIGDTYVPFGEKTVA